MDVIDLKIRIDRHSPTWMAIEQFLNHHLKSLHETLETPRDTGLERFDQGQIRLCRLLMDAAKPSRPEGEKGAGTGHDYGFQSSV